MTQRCPKCGSTECGCPQVRLPIGHHSNTDITVQVLRESYELQKQALQLMRESAEQYKKENDKLREDLKYSKNIGAMSELVSLLPEASRTRILDARKCAIVNGSCISVTVPTDIMFLGSPVKWTMEFDFRQSRGDIK